MKSLLKSILNKRNIPNFITGSRIVLFLADLFAIKYTHKTYEVAHLLFCILGGAIYFMDWLDGYIARKYGWQSKFGAIFDPAGDKIVAYSMLAYLYTLGVFPLWALTIILFRDIVLSAIRLASVKHDFTFKTSQMGKLRTNIIGFGGGIIYLLYYWGEFYFIKVRIGFSHMIILVISCLTIFNIVRIPNRYMLKLFPRFIDKLGAVVTFIIAAVYPQNSIVYAMIWITLYTLWDYGRAFKHEIEQVEDRPTIKKFLVMAMLYALIGIGMTFITIGALKFGLIYSIIIAGAVLTILLMQNFSLIRLKQKLQKLKQTTQTSNINA